MPVNKEWQAIPPFEAFLGEVIKLFEYPHCYMQVKGMSAIYPNCRKYCGRPGSAVGKPSSHISSDKNA